MQATMVQEMFGEACPASAPFFGYMGASAALIFASEFSAFFYSQPFACLHKALHTCAKFLRTAPVPGAARQAS
jgi:hypothetical protein